MLLMNDGCSNSDPDSCQIRLSDKEIYGAETSNNYESLSRLLIQIPRHRPAPDCSPKIMANSQNKSSFPNRLDSPSTVLAVAITSGSVVSQVARLVVISILQPENPIFKLEVQPEKLPSCRAQFYAALSIVALVRRMILAENRGADVLIFPRFASVEPRKVADEAVDINISRIPTCHHLQSLHALQFPLEEGVNPALAALQLAQYLASMSLVDVVFNSACAQIVCQVLSLTRAHLLQSGQEFAVFPGETDSSSNAGWTLSFRAITLNFLSQVMVGDPGASSNLFMLPPSPISAPFPSIASASAPSTSPATLPWDLPAHGVRLSDGLPSHVSPSSSVMDQLAVRHPESQALPKSWNEGIMGMRSRPSSSTSSLPSSISVAGGGLVLASPTSHARPRARKADWVIVTEDTAIKNAAGAVAKVLGRVADLGQSCPVFTEKKRENYTGVISVAVKAITVARGYVSNEGTGHEIGFQPYLKEEQSARGAGPGAGEVVGSPADHKPNPRTLQPMPEQSPALFSQTFAQGSGFLSKHHIAPANRSLSLPVCASAVNDLEQEFGGMNLHASSGAARDSPGSGMDQELQAMDKAEMAFDVYKVLQVPEIPEIGNLPVKVTAHSRPSVVSSIITKLVSERSGAVLITAGGKAMHVAMIAVVNARARLRARGCDLLLVPRFVTVDTTNTLGWESVFLRFSIIQWPLVSRATPQTPRLRPVVPERPPSGLTFTTTEMPMNAGAFNDLLLAHDPSMEGFVVHNTVPDWSVV